MIRNDEKSLKEIEELNFDAIVISPGPGIPENAGILMELIAAYYHKKPILGICLGHQALGQFFGLPLIKAPYPMHGKVSNVSIANHPMWNQVPNGFEVCRYHSLVIDFKSPNAHKLDSNSNQKKSVSQDLEATAYSTDDNLCMAFAHKNLPIWGIQFHPEAILTQYGLIILKNWLKAVNLH